MRVIDTILTILTIIVTVLIVYSILVLLRSNTPYVQQKVIEEPERILCPSGTCVVTIVWKDTKILHSQWDDIDVPQDTLDARLREAQAIAHKVKTLER